MENIMPPLTPDQIIKNLLRDYPVEALEFFNENIIKKYGYPVKINFNIQEIKKSSHFDSRPHLPNQTSPRLRRALSTWRGLYINKFFIDIELLVS